MNSAIFKGYDSIFAKRLRSLIDEKGTTIQAVAENISDMSGTKITRQAVSQYADGTTMPNAERIYYIAQYFGVSADYLLGLSDVQSTDTTVKSVCDYTGLSEKAVSRIRQIARADDKILYKLESSKKVRSTLNSILEEIKFDSVVYNTLYYCEDSKKLFDLYNELMNEDKLITIDDFEKFHKLERKTKIDLFDAWDYLNEIINRIAYPYKLTDENNNQLNDKLVLNTCEIYGNDELKDIVNHSNAESIDTEKEGEQSGKHTED